MGGRSSRDGGGRPTLSIASGEGRGIAGATMTMPMGGPGDDDVEEAIMMTTSIREATITTIQQSAL
jgi:hypothetical protein